MLILCSTSVAELGLRKGEGQTTPSVLTLFIFFLSFFLKT